MEKAQLTTYLVNLDAGINVRLSKSYLRHKGVAKRSLEPIYAGRDQNG